MNNLTVEISQEARKIFDNVDWSQVTVDIQSGKVKVKQMSETLGVNGKELRQELINRYGNRIEFRRGRTGGVRLLPTGDE